MFVIRVFGRVAHQSRHIMCASDVGSRGPRKRMGLWPNWFDRRAVSKWYTTSIAPHTDRPGLFTRSNILWSCFHTKWLACGSHNPPFGEQSVRPRNIGYGSYDFSLVVQRRCRTPLLLRKGQKISWMIVQAFIKVLCCLVRIFVRHVRKSRAAMKQLLQC